MRTQIKLLVKKYKEMAERVYGRDFDTISIDWTQRRSTVAGKAYMTRWSVWINIPVHQAKPEMLEDTVAHEVAHLIAYEVHGRAGTGHGAGWQSTMRKLGRTPSRTFNGTAEQRLAGKNMTRHIYRCDCGYELNVSAKRHNSIRRGATVWHTGHKHMSITFVRTTDKHTILREQIAAQADKTPVTSVVRPPRKPAKAPKATSKLAQCRALYDWTETRPQNIVRFVTEAGCTTAGAATYYAKIKKES
jgi:SprT protein